MAGGKLKEMKVVARADLNDNALRREFLWWYGMGQVILLLSRAILRLPVPNPTAITTTIRLKDDLYHTYHNTWQRNVAAIDNASNMNRQMVWVRFRITQGRLADRTPGVAPTWKLYSR